MAEQKARNEDAKDSQGQSSDEDIPSAMDKDQDNETGHSPSPQATQVQGNEPAIGENFEDTGDIHVEASTSGDRLQDASNESQVGDTPFRQYSLCHFARYLLESSGRFANLNA